MAVLNLIDTQLYTGNGGGGYCEVVWRDLKSETLECKCNEDDREKLKRILLGESHYKEKPRIDLGKENDIMAQYQYACGKIEAIKTQEEIELEEKLAKLKAEYDKKVAKLREEFKAAKEKRLNDQHSKEIHDKYQSLIDAGFTEEKAWEILKTMLGEFEL